MHVRRAASVVEVSAPAKLNLSLDVLAKRADGFHEIETLMAPIGLWDSLGFEPDAGGQLVCDCRWGSRALALQSPVPALPTNADNLAVRAVQRLRERAGVEFGARLRLVKRIPAAAGLGGGSSDAAAALVAANLGWRLAWPVARLAEVAAEVGSDVPFFLYGQPAVCRGRGERVQGLAGLAPWHYVVAQPPVGLSTAEVYGRCRPQASSGRLAALVAALRAGCGRRLRQLVHNGLQSAAESLSPWLARMREEFGRLHFLAHQMTGSGSAYFGICLNARHARRSAAHLQARGLGRVFAAAGLC